MPENRTSLNHRPYESVYVHRETTIDHPVERVWPHALNIGGWMSAHQLETLAGDAGKVGHFERVLPRGLGDDVPRPHYHLYGIAEIVPNKLIALEVLPEQGGSYGNTREWMSFDTILLTELGDSRTKITFVMIDVHMGKGEPEFHQKRQQELEEVAGRLLAGYFENLKQLIAGCG